jgi:hypothetical protein
MQPSGCPGDGGPPIVAYYDRRLFTKKTNHCTDIGNQLVDSKGFRVPDSPASYSAARDHIPRSDGGRPRGAAQRNQIYDTLQRLSENRNPLVAGLSTFHDAEGLTLSEGLGSPHKAAAYKH